MAHPTMPNRIDVVVIIAGIVGFSVWASNNELDQYEGGNRKIILLSRRLLDNLALSWTYTSPDVKSTLPDGPTCLNVGEDEAQLTMVDLFDNDSGANMEDVWKNVFEFAANEGIPARANVDVAMERFDKYVCDSRPDGSCPFGTDPALARGPEGDVTVCQLSADYDAESNYYRTGGIARRHESGEVLKRRTTRFVANIPRSLLTTKVGAALQKYALSPKLQSVATKSNMSIIHQSSLAIEVHLPGGEIPYATAASKFVGIGSSSLPPWFRRLMAQSCVFEKNRIQTIRAISWWTSNSESSLHNFYTGKQDSQVEWPMMSNVTYIFDDQKIMHSVVANDSNTGAGRQQHHLCDLNNAKIVYDGRKMEWNIMSSAGVKILSLNKGDVTLSLTNEANIFKDKEHQTFSKRKGVDTPSIQSVLNAMLDDLRIRGMMKYKEHLLQENPARLRWKLADFLISEYIKFIKPKYYIQSNLNLCYLLQFVPGVLYDTMVEWAMCDVPCQKPEEPTLARDKSDM